MNIFELAAKISLDTKDYEQGIDKAKKLISNVKEGITTVAEKTVEMGKVVNNTGETAVKAFAGISTAVGAAAGALIKFSTDAYGDFEQLKGGVETLFKDSAGTVMKFADDAYKTAGLSANKYMETVTSFSASLLQSLGRGEQTDLDDLKYILNEEYEATKQAAEDEYKATKRALEDEYQATKDSWDARISYAKKSGIKNTDNLKEQRDEELKQIKRSNEDALALLKQSNEDALALLKQNNKQKLEEAERANNQSEVTAETHAKAAEAANMAISDMSDNANKMGTDMSMIQNAYQGFAKQNYTMLDNLKLGYGGTKAEMERLIEDAAELSDTVDAQSLSFANIVEAIHVVQTNMGITGTTAKEAATTIQGSAASMKASWENFLTALATGSDDADEKLESLLSSIQTYAGNLIPAVSRTIRSVYNIIEKNSDRAISFIVGLFGNAAKKAPEMIQSGKDLIKKVVDGISQNKESLKTDAIDIFNALADGFEESLDVLLPLAEDLVPTFVKILLEYKGLVFNTGLDIILSLIRGIASDPEGLKDTASGIIGALVDKLSSEETLNTLVGSGAVILGALAGAIVDNIGDSKSGILGVPSKIIGALVEETKKKETLDGLANGAVTILSALADFIFSNLSTLGQAAIDIIEGFVLGLSKEENLEKLEEGAESIVIAVSDFFANLDAETAERLSDAGYKIIEAIVSGIFSEESLKAFETAFLAWLELLPSIIQTGLNNSPIGLFFRLIMGDEAFEAAVRGQGGHVGGGVNSGGFGSHRNGLSYVPYDGYVAELHEGERVLTRSEARDYNSGGGGISISVTVNGAKYSDEESLAEAVAEKIQDMIERERDNND